MTGSVIDRMAYIEKLFMQVLHFSETARSTNEILQYIDQLHEPDEYRSIVYESASMAIALRSFKTGAELGEWIEFRNLRKSIEHEGHVHIGLGMGLAAAEKYSIPKAVELHSLLHSLVFDGMGYYDALFRGRTALKDKNVPAEVRDWQNYYDQGIGRRIWYHCRGDLNKLNLMISSFPQNRHASLWKGIGIACGYVGGNIKKGMEELQLLSGENKYDLGAGILLAVLSRIQSQSVNEDFSTACLIAGGCTVDQLIEDDIKLTDFNSMKDLVDHVKSNFSSVNPKTSVF